MGISSAFSVAQSGLRATSLWAETTSANISNAQTPGYVRRELVTTSSTTGDGATVKVSAIRRQVDTSLNAMQRLETARLARQEVHAGALAGYLERLGQPSDEASPAARLGDFQTSLDLLSTTPGDRGAQRGVLDSAESLAAGIRSASATLQQARTDARADLAGDLKTVNQTLATIARADKALAAEDGETARRASLEDELARGLDKLAEYMDIEVTEDAAGRTRIHTTGGTPLVDSGDAATLTWDDASETLTANGIEITPGESGRRGFSEGRLAGRIEVLTGDIPGVQRQLDELARLLVVGFEDADASLGAGQAGLFTDDGAPFDPSAIEGLASRLKVNDAVRPEAGGALWRIRDGMGAAVAGAEGGTAQVNAFIDALQQSVPFDAAAGLGPSGSIGDFAADMVTDQQQIRATAERSAGEIEAGLGALDAARSRIEGVNVDTELQTLMQVEQAYAANSQVLKSLSEMMDILLSSV